MKRGLALFLTVTTAGALLKAAGPMAADIARLTTISSRVSSQGASLVIEATEPVGYISTRPDPLTIAIDFRNVAADGVANSVLSNMKSPIAGVAVEAVDAQGVPASRVRITLAQPVTHHVRSDRNTIIVDLDALAAPTGLRPPTARRDGSLISGASRRAEMADAPAVDPLVALGLSGAALSPSSAVPSAAPLRPANPLPQQAPAVSAQAQAPAGQTPPRRFTGNPISLDFQGADLRAVLRTFAEVSGLNIVIDPKVTGMVDVALRDVPWDQALDIILRANDLDYTVEDAILRIAPIDVFTAEDTKRKLRADAKAEAQASTEPLTTLTRQLSYAKGDDIVRLLTETRTVTKHAKPQFDARTNTIIVADVPGQMTQIRALIDVLDKPQPQVEIEARIVQTNKNYARQLGVQWGFNGVASPGLGNTTNLAFPNSGSIGGRVGGAQGPAGGPAASTAVNLGVGAASSAIGLSLGSVNGAFNLDVALSALETSGNGKLLSTPKVSTLNNVSAEMSQGVQIPIQTVANNTVTVTFKDAALKLLVTPTITAANTVIMQIQLENAAPDYSKSVNNIPPINTQRANTSVLVGDGQTTVIGGIYTSNSTAQTDSTPGLGRVPLLRWLFKKDQVQDQNTELLIFITPRIVKNQ